MEFKYKESLYDYIVNTLNDYGETSYCDKIEDSSDILYDLGFDSVDLNDVTKEIEIELGLELGLDLNVTARISVKEYTNMVWNAINKRKK